MKQTKLLFTAAFLLLLTACSSTNTLRHPTTQATLWVQNSAEYKAITTQTYATALRVLPLALEDSYWTASLNHENDKEYASLPPAVILDVDETVLDNSPFQARMIRQNSSFNPEAWNKWANEGRAEAVPGAVEFTNYAADEGVAVFFITNRDSVVEAATRRNLDELGFPISDTLDNLLTKGEQPGWTSAKTERRKLIEENYRVVMIFGDDLNDFIPAKNITAEERDIIIQEYSDYFGRRWYIFPNPVYGSWEQALFNFQNGLSNEEKEEVLLDNLDTKENKN